MNKPIQRWDVDCDDIDASMFTNKTGDYVLYDDHVAEMEATAASELVNAAQAVLDRWDSPRWEWATNGPTGNLMQALREAIDAAIAQPKETK